MPLSTFLNGGTATQLRGLQWLSLSDLGKVGTRTATSDSGGGASVVWSFGSDVPCRIDPVASSGENEDIVAARLSDRSQYVITVPTGTTVPTDNRFAVAGRGTFEVTAVRTRTAQWATFFEAVPVS
jgi:hypothetical protein